MKKMLSLILICILAFVGCGVANELEEIKDLIPAAAEEISTAVDEIKDSLDSDSIVDELVALEALKYDVTEQDILDSFAADNKTALETFQTAADVVGLSLEDYLVFAKDAFNNLTDEQLETLRAMNQVTSALEDVSEIAEHVGGEKTGDELLAVIELINIEVETIVEDDSGDGWMGMSYLTSKPCDEVIDYFIELLKGTDGYSITQFSGADFAFIEGTVEDGILQIEIENDDGDEFTTVVYTYTY